MATCDWQCSAAQFGEVDALHRDAPVACCSCSARSSCTASAPSFRCPASTRPRSRASSSDQEGTILGMFNMFSGGALQRACRSSRMGVMPYISASIIMQMMSVVVLPLAGAAARKASPGRRKITQYTRYGTVVLGGVPGASPPRSHCRTRACVHQPGLRQFLLPATITLTAGTMFLMWLGEQITERGIGNGISMIILSGIVAGLPAAIGGTLRAGAQRRNATPAFALILVADRRRASTAFCRVRRARASAASRSNYAKRQVGRRMYARPDHAPAVQAQHVGRDPADLRLEPAAVPGDDRAASSAPATRAAGCRRSPRRSARASRCTWCSTAR